MNRTIEIIIAPSGEIHIDSIGFKGADCERATKFLEEGLGGGWEKGEETGVSPERFFSKSRAAYLDWKEQNLHPNNPPLTSKEEFAG